MREETEWEKNLSQLTSGYSELSTDVQPNKDFDKRPHAVALSDGCGRMRTLQFKIRLLQVVFYQFYIVWHSAITQRNVKGLRTCWSSKMLWGSPIRTLAHIFVSLLFLLMSECTVKTLQKKLSEQKNGKLQVFPFQMLHVMYSIFNIAFIYYNSVFNLKSLQYIPSHPYPWNDVPGLCMRKLSLTGPL